MSKRRTPIAHTVRAHTRRGGVKVSSYQRGSGRPTARRHSSYRPPRLAKSRAKLDDHGRRLKHPGESISYKDRRGRRVTGTVRGVRKEYYIVERKGKLTTVDRKSIFEYFPFSMHPIAEELSGKKTDTLF